MKEESLLRREFLLELVGYPKTDGEDLHKAEAMKRG
jgi:hypothetical protein